MAEKLWTTKEVGGEEFSLMNLDHAEVEQRVIAEMDAGVAVFYDRRWDATEILTNWLGENLERIKGKRILVLGAGVGMETLLLAKHAEHIWINDLAPVALELCQEQLAENGLTNVTTLLGRYEEIDLPEVDLTVASFLVYDKDTLQSMKTHLSQTSGELILMNETLGPFASFLKQTQHEVLFQKEGAWCISL